MHSDEILKIIMKVHYIKSGVLLPGKSPGEGKGYPLQYSGLENSVDHIVQGVGHN